MILESENGKLLEVNNIIVNSTDVEEINQSEMDLLVQQISSMYMLLDDSQIAA
jgi:hypothetical protein